MTTADGKRLVKCRKDESSLARDTVSTMLTVLLSFIICLTPDLLHSVTHMFGDFIYQMGTCVRCPRYRNVRITEGYTPDKRIYLYFKKEHFRECPRVFEGI